MVKMIHLCRHKAKILVFTLGWIVSMAGVVCAPPAVAADRAYFIAADEVNWDYAPAGRDRMMGMPFDEAARGFVKRGDTRIGKVYIKARYREYMDETFTVVKPRPPRWQHLGLLGPVIRAEVGDTIRVVFRNNTGFPASVHPHGVFYSKAAEGSPYADGTTGKDKHDDAVPPGGQHTYLWSVPERAGPGPADPSSIFWLYHSHAIRDRHSGLIGPILVTAKGRAQQDGSPHGVDREFITLFSVSDENESWYIDKNIATLAGRAQVSKDDAGFRESNRMHGINGYVYGNLPGLHMDQCQRTRWYVAAVGNEVDLHTPHWHGNAGLLNGHRVDVVELLPASFKVVDMVTDNAGTWMYHCHVDDHLRAGMTALYTVRAIDSVSCGP